MSCFNLPASQPFYNAARAFAELALRHDRFLFTPGVASTRILVELSQMLQRASERALQIPDTY